MRKRAPRPCASSTRRAGLWRARRRSSPSRSCSASRRCARRRCAPHHIPCLTPHSTTRRDGGGGGRGSPCAAEHARSTLPTRPRPLLAAQVPRHLARLHRREAAPIACGAARRGQGRRALGRLRLRPGALRGAAGACARGDGARDALPRQADRARAAALPQLRRPGRRAADGHATVAQSARAGVAVCVLLARRLRGRRAAARQGGARRRPPRVAQAG